MGIKIANPYGVRRKELLSQSALAAMLKPRDLSKGPDARPMARLIQSQAIDMKRKPTFLRNFTNP